MHIHGKFSRGRIMEWFQSGEELWNDFRVSNIHTQLYVKVIKRMLKLGLGAPSDFCFIKRFLEN